MSSSRLHGQLSRCFVWLSLTSHTGTSGINLPHLGGIFIEFRSEPNLKTVRELIYKRGYGKVNKQRIPLANNQVIEETLGKFDILSVEDLVHEIFSAGPNFKQVRVESPVSH